MSIASRRLSRTYAYTTPTPPGEVTHGQQITATNTGRSGAAIEGVAHYSPTLTTLSGNRTYSTTQTIRNTQFTGNVQVTGGNVTFEFCSFTYAPPTAGTQLRLYNGGSATGSVTCNWCDFDPGLRGNQGVFESTCFQAGERGSANPATTSGLFMLYRCALAGCGNIVGMHKFYAGASSIIESYLHSPTSGGGSHPDGVEIYTANNITFLRSRIEIDSTNGQSCINITRDFGQVSVDQPTLIQDCYINGGISPVLTRDQGGVATRVFYKGNFFGDSSQWGRECDFNSMNVTYNEAYALSHPDVIYWAPSNVWAPNGEGIGGTTSASGETKAGLPHTPGSFVDSRNFYGGEVWIWNGSVVGPAGP